MIYVFVSVMGAQETDSVLDISTMPVPEIIDVLMCADRIAIRDRPMSMHARHPQPCDRKADGQRYGTAGKHGRMVAQTRPT